MTLMRCSQKVGNGQCEQPGLYRYTWPGKDESVICELHVGRLRAVAEAMGFHLQIIPILDEATS